MQIRILAMLRLGWVLRKGEVGPAWEMNLVGALSKSTNSVYWTIHSKNDHVSLIIYDRDHFECSTRLVVYILSLAQFLNFILDFVEFW